MKRSNLSSLSLLLVFAMLAGLLAACGSSGGKGGASDGGKVELTMLFQESLFGGIHEKLFEEYEKDHLNVKIKAETTTDGGIFDTFRTKISTSDMPDMFQINPGHITTKLANEGGYIMDIGSVEASQNYSEQIIKATTLSDGKYALFTPGVGIMGFAYNKTMFKEAGYDTPPATWEELMDLGQKLKDQGKDLLVYGSKWETSIANVFHWTFGLYAQKDAAFKEAYLTNNIDWSKPEYRALLEEGMNRFKELNQYVRTGSFTNEYAGAQQSFANNEAAMLMGGTWEAATLRKLAPDMDLGFMNLPYADKSANPVIFSPEDGIAINAKGSHIEETKAFLNWLFSKETYLKFQTAKGTFSAMPGVGELDKSYEEANVPDWLNSQTVITFANTGPIPSPTWIALGNAAQEYTFKNDLDKSIDAFIAEYNKTKGQ